VITLWWKISVHAAIAAGAATVLMLIFGPALLGAWPLVALIAWSRVQVDRPRPARSGRTGSALLPYPKEEPLSFTEQVLDDVRAQIAPEDAALKEARERRDTTRTAAEGFDGVRHSFASGSLAHGTANCPIHERDKGLDADAGVVLDRRSHPTLGPDAEDQDGPTPIVEAMRDHLRRELRPDYPQVKFRITKRAILISFHESLPGGEDPTVDLVVGLERVDEPGLWIPNTETDDWDPSDPEEHTRLLTTRSDPKALRVIRARAIRLAKAECKRTAVPPLCSFNLEAFGLMFVERDMDEPSALLALWAEGARDLRRRLTPDPAGVSTDHHDSGPCRVDRAHDRAGHTDVGGGALDRPIAGRGTRGQLGRPHRRHHLRGVPGCHARRGNQCLDGAAPQPRGGTGPNPQHLRRRLRGLHRLQGVPLRHPPPPGG
jgi:hypothetical protein